MPVPHVAAEFPISADRTQQGVVDLPKVGRPASIAESDHPLEAEKRAKAVLRE
jgi:hypothetical protein